jgi:3-methyladenine DNA glycosylase/8-oxoguanine DNA glycosylase
MTRTVNYAEAQRYLSRQDPVLAEMIRRHGRCGLKDAQREDPFQAIVEAIAWQQLSGKAAATIFGRFLALFSGDAFPAPEIIDARSDVELRAVGLSRQKIGYLRDLCARLRTGALALDRLDEMPDDDVVQMLTQVKGIGRWTAEMVLMFRLQRPDVLPVDDLGIRNAMKKAYRLRKPTAERLLKIGERWRPYRSIAAWYLWASLENAPMEEEAE